VLTIHVGSIELFDEETSEFYYSTDGPVLELEHSLVSLSKWESKWKKPFLGTLDKHAKTDEEATDYVLCMILTPDFPPDILQKFSKKNFEDVQAYINDTMTATWFNDRPGQKRSSETITAELIYYWMDSANIPPEAEHWHLNRLFTRIKIHMIKNSKPQKMSMAEALRQQHQLNEQRRAQYGTRG
jgi:hypothetical protein